MGKILIVGPNSFIAKNFMEQLDLGSYDIISVREDNWKSYNYSDIETIIYFSAIVHHPEITDEKIYNKVNAYIPYNMALIALKQGVSKFIYISTVSVFGKDPMFGEINTITRSTLLKPKTPYGRSKVKGEQMLSGINGLYVQLVRLPNVYGKDCPGTFYHRIEQLSRLKWLPIYKNNYKYSLISVANVVEALSRLLTLDESGIYCPQDMFLLSITDRIKNMALDNGIKQKQIKWMWPILWLANKIFPKKYTNNLYGGYYIDPNEFPVLTD